MPLNKLPARYESLDSKESGGMGDVHLYRDKFLDRNVAVKCIKSPEFSTRLMDEVKAFKSVRSKHVVETFDIISTDSDVCIVQEYLPGDELIPMEEYDQDIFMKNIYQIASGILEIHECGLIHRDIKPNNMKFDDEGILKIFDFGLSRTVGIDDKTSGFKGTYYFAAPELFESGQVSFDQSIDVYAFAVTCLLHATASLPQALCPLRNKEQVLTPFKDELSGKIPDRIITLLDSCLDYNPDCRPKMREVYLELERHLVFNRHRALVVLNGTPNYLDQNNKSVRLKSGNDIIIIGYDGLDFSVISTEGYVRVNNSVVSKDYIMPGASVISFGSPADRYRRHVTFDISKPGVVL